MFDIRGDYKPGIYQIRNIVNNKRYVGSSLSVRRRCSQHLHFLRNGKHHCKHLLNAWNKYGEDNFEFQCIEYCDPENLLPLEHKYIVEYKTTDREFGYNTTEDVEHYDAVFTKEDRERISNGLRGRKWTEELRLKFIKAKTGKKSKKLSETKKRQFAEGTAHLLRLTEVSKLKHDEWCKRISEGRKKYFENTSDPIKVPIMLRSDEETLYFPSMKSAAKYLDVHADTLLIRIKKGTSTKRVPYIVSRISVELYKSITNV